MKCLLFYFFIYVCKISRIFTFQKYKKGVEEAPGMVEFTHERFKTQEICEKAVERCLYELTIAPDQYRAQQMFETAVLSDTKKLRFVFNHFKNHNISEIPVCVYSFSLKSVLNLYNQEVHEKIIERC